MNRGLAILIVLAGCDQVFNLTRPPDAAVDAMGDAIDARPGACGFADAGPAHPIPSKATGIVAGNFDQQGNADVAVGTTSKSQLLIRYSDNNNFGTSMDVDVGAPVLALATGNIDIDGFDDIAFVTATSANAMLQTASSWDRRMVASIGGAPRSVTLANFDGVGLTDMVVAIPGGELVQLFIGGDLGYTAGTSIPTTSSTPIAAVGADMDADADPDVVIAFEDDNEVGMYRDTGANFDPGGRIAAGMRPATVVVGKLGDRAAYDMLVLNEVSNDITVVRNDGNGNFMASDVLRVGQGPRAMLLADFDADGFADIVVANNKANSFSLLRGTASGFELAQDHTTVGKPIGVAAADFTGDRLLDLAVLGEDDGFVIHTTVCASR